MWLDNPVIKEDLEYILSLPFIEWEKFRNKHFFVTGATGLIGSMLINALIYADIRLSLNIRITALVRDSEKAKNIFKEQLAYNNLIFEKGDVKDFSSSRNDYDYIVHGANPTSSRFFAENPVETIITAFEGTRNILELARSSSVSGVVYLSSMEVYGTPETDERIKECHSCNLDLSAPRSSYPESKRICESLCVSFASEYSVPVRILRLTQTFGPGVHYDDARVFAEFARCVIEGKDIILATKGETRRSYLYTADAVSAILILLLKGEDGQAYNAANEDTYCSIFEMASMVSSEFGRNTNVRIDESVGRNRGFAPVLHMNLDTEKITRLGWKPGYSLHAMYSNLISTMKTY